MDVSLLDGFELRCDGELVPLAAGEQRLVGFIAVHGRPLERAFAAGTLWPETTDERAAASLRSALWRLRRPPYVLVESAARRLRLGSAVHVDLHTAVRLANEILEGSRGSEDGDDTRMMLSQDLLPEWMDDWAAVERERFRQLRLHALETMCERLTASGAHAKAVEAGLAAVAGEPLRESAHRALIKAHLAEGNRAEAIRQYRAFRTLLADELGVNPSPLLEELVPVLRF